MSGDPRAGLVSAFVTPIADEAAAQRSRPPHAQRQSRAGYGAFFLSWCWVTLDVCGPRALTPPPPVLLYAWWSCAALGVFSLLAGFFGRARGPLVGALGLFAEAAGASWLLWNNMYPAAMSLAAFLLHGLYLSVLCAALAQIAAVLITLPSRDAERVVHRNMAAKNPPIIPVRRAR